MYGLMAQCIAGLDRLAAWIQILRERYAVLPFVNHP